MPQNIKSEGEPIPGESSGSAHGVSKCPSGINGLDEITDGGLPRGRPTLVCGGAGCGKTLLAMEFLVRGVTQYNEPGVFIAFEETAEDLAANVRSLGFDLDQLIREKRFVVDHVHIDRSETEEVGDYNLEGLFVRMGHAIDSVGAKRVVLDTIENLFTGLSNQSILRSELRRLFQWLKKKGVTAVITGERGDGSLTRQGLEEYVSDCVILLDNRVVHQMSTRRLRVVKYRGSYHGSNEYPFLIDRSGISVLPITSVGLSHPASTERVLTGVARLDTMLGGGYYRGSSVLVSGVAGAGKTSLAAHFADAACRRGERCLYFAFEESPDQMVRNMRSIGIDLAPWMAQGLLRVHASRTTAHGLETHLAGIHRLVQEYEPRVVVLDPVTNFLAVGSASETQLMLVRLIDYLKSQGITALFTSLTAGGATEQATDAHISSLIDTWLVLRDIETDGERNRGLYVIKSRGMAHSKQVRECLLTDHGVELVDVYVGAEGVLTGAARQTREASDRAKGLARQQEADRRRRDLDRKRQKMEADIASIREAFEAEQAEVHLMTEEYESRESQRVLDRSEMSQRRQADKSTDLN